MRKSPSVPLTKDNFEAEYKDATGLNFISLDWIVEHIPETVAEKEIYFAKLVRNIQLNKDRWVDNTLNKYGRFRIYADYEEAISQGSDKSTCDVQKLPENDLRPSALVEMLEELIDELAGMRYLMGDTGVYILTSSGQKILI